MKTLLLLSTLMLFACQIPTAIIDKQNKLVLPKAQETMGSVQIFDQEALKYIDKNAQYSVRGKNFTWIEGPTWIEEGQFLIFSEIPKNRIMKYHPKHGLSVYLDNPGYMDDAHSNLKNGSNGLLLNRKNELLLMQQGDRQIAKMLSPVISPKHQFKALVTRYGGKRFNGPNDLVEHSDGSLFFTDPTYGLNKNDPTRQQELSFSGVYRLSPDGNVSVIDKTLTFPNGIGLSPDEKNLYVAISDKHDQHWVAYDLGENGQVSNKRRFFDANHVVGIKGYKGGADGLAVHSSGALFATGPGGVWLLSATGKPLALIETGQNTANCTLTTNEDYLFVTADDYLLSLPIKPF